MAKGKFPNRDWSKEPTANAYEFVFNTHFWGDRSKSGKGPNGGWTFNKRTNKPRTKQQSVSVAKAA